MPVGHCGPVVGHSGLPSGPLGVGGSRSRVRPPLPTSRSAVGCLQEDVLCIQGLEGDRDCLG